MGLDSIYDYGINSPLDYSSEDEADSSYYALQLGLAEVEAEEDADSSHYALQLGLAEVQAEEEADSSHYALQLGLAEVQAEEEAEALKTRLQLGEQRLVNLERLVAELGEKKPLFQMVVVCFTVLVLAVAIIMFA
ncbi:hypothetical protein Bca4012_067241 [Brassica carinata]